VIEALDQVAIAVKSLGPAVAFFRDVLGLEPGEAEDVPSQGVRVVKFTLGETAIELLEPTGPSSPIARFLETRGEGIHHVAFRVHDLEAALKRLAAANVPLVHSTPQPGAGGKRIAFASPKGTHGVLMEFCE